MSLLTGSLSQEMWMQGKAVLAFPGLIGEALAHPADADQTLTEKVSDYVGLQFLRAVSVVSIPPWFAVTGLVFVGEKAWGLFNGLQEMAAQVRQFGRSLEEQKRIIDEFNPLLQLSEKVVKIGEKVRERKEKIEENTRALKELEANYQPHADLLHRVSDMVVYIKTALEKRLAGLLVVQEKALQNRMAVLKDIDEEEKQMKQLTVDLLKLIAQAEEKEKQLTREIERATVMTKEKGQRISDLGKSVEIAIPMGEASDGQPLA